MRIDVVIPFVDGSDPIWRELYKKEFNEDPIAKYRSNSDLFKYNLRSIAKNMPWINNLYIIVMSDSQIPDWLNKDTVKIIYHKDFIPEEYLPTFNECTIELFQHKIPGLSEYYLVGNDDYLVTALMTKDDFFTSEGTPKITWVKGLNIENVTPWWSISSHSYQLFVKQNAGHMWVPNHTYSPHRKQSWEELWTEYKETLEKSITKKADHVNFNQYAAQYYWFAQGKTAKGTIKGQSYPFIKPFVICFIYEFLHNKQQLMCLNDTRDEYRMIAENTTTYAEVMKLIESKFPEKSKYEY